MEQSHNQRDDNAMAHKVDHWAVLEEDFKAQTPPEDAITTKQYSEHFNVTYQVAETCVAKLVRAGKLKLLGKYVRDGRPTKFYEVVR